MKLKLYLLFFVLFAGCGLLKAQDIEYGVELDTNYMLIGDQQRLTFKLKSGEAVKVEFPMLKDTIVKGVEIVSGPLCDSVKGKDGMWLYTVSYLFTVFDTGLYTIPSLPIILENNNYNNTLRTEPVGFVVNTYQVDEQAGYKDIVMPYDTPLNFAEVLPYLLWALLGLAVIGACIWVYMRYKSDKPLFVPVKEVIPPYVKAIRTLDEIRAAKLYQSDKVKEYYTRLTDVVRQYLDDEFHVAAMEQTSLEIVRALEGCKMVDDADREKVAELLQCADFVKFAKMIPLSDENVRYLDRAYEFVNNTNKRLKEEEDKLKQKEEKEKKDKVVS